MKSKEYSNLVQKSLSIIAASRCYCSNYSLGAALKCCLLAVIVNMTSSLVR